MSILDMNINSFLMISRSKSLFFNDKYIPLCRRPVGKKKTREIAYEVNTYTV